MMTPDELARWDQICLLATGAGRPGLKSTAIKRWLNAHEEDRAVLLELPDAALLEAFKGWRRDWPQMRDPEKVVPMLIDLAEGRIHVAAQPQYPWPRRRGCEWCEDGSVLCTELVYPRRATTEAIRDGKVVGREYDCLRPCPECNGGKWPFKGRPLPNPTGSYRTWCDIDEVEFYPDTGEIPL